MCPIEDPPAVHAVTPVIRPLASSQLYRTTDAAALSFETTAEITPLDAAMTQQRVVDSVRFGSQIKQPGFNLFVIGPRGAKMREALTALLEGPPQNRPLPNDWVYVINFNDVNKPLAIDLPAGRAPEFQRAMHALVEDLRVTLPSNFESDEYSTRRNAIDDAAQKSQAELFSALRDKASAKGIVILRTPMGFALAPARDGAVVPPDVFEKWPEAERAATKSAIEDLEKDLEQVIRQIPQIEKEHRNAVRQLNRETAAAAVGHLIDETKTRFADLPRIVTHLEAMRLDLLENVGLFMSKGESGDDITQPELSRGPFERYEVNVLISQEDHPGKPPLVEELHPTLSNLIGRIEYVAHQGTLVTNFRMIRAGALHRANGGYLLIDARSLLTEPFSWDALKRTLRRQTIKIEDAARFLGLASTVSLEPEPIPLDVKVFVFGDRLLYYLLAELDPEMTEHFKVIADFSNDLERTAESEAAQARVIASLVARSRTKPLNRDAVAAVIERSARMAGHAGKLSLMSESLQDLVVEADYWAAAAGRTIVGRDDVQKAVAQREYRAARLRDQVQESILSNLALISTSGSAIGQINGLSVLELGGFSFGEPTRITCRVRPGAGKVVDIEREVELGGPTHSKGVLILSGFLAGRYALDTPMSLFASLVFEQSYSNVEGDSASSAELYALMSALADVPLRQDLSVTGSVNQHGAVQAIGGVNQKIEGFFDICQRRGLTGTQGVLIPSSNVQHLMLRADVIEACAAEKFAVYAVASIDEGIELLTGIPAGQRNASGRFPENSVNARIEKRLREFANVRRNFAAADKLAAPSGGAS